MQHLGELSSRDEAETATRLTLAALGDRISGGQAADLAAVLPGELRPCLEQAAEPAQAFRDRCWPRYRVNGTLL